jgi:hypothetical protein
MQELLFKYLAQATTVSLEGLGTLQLVHTPPQYQTVEQTFTAPSQYINFEKNAAITSPKFIEYVATQKQISNTEAADLIAKTTKNDWVGIGEFKQNELGEDDFIPYNLNIVTNKIVAEKVIRKEEEHYITVGEQEKTNTEMSAFYNEEINVAQSKWWIAALLIGLATIGYIIFYYLTNKN